MQTPPRGQKVWALPLETACPPSCEIFSPRGIFGKLLRVPRSLTRAVMNFLLPRGPRIARGGECAGAKKSKTPPCLGRRTALDAWCIDVGPVGQILNRPVWSPALEAGHSLHGSVPRALARRGPGTASENHALQNAAGGKEWTV
uniref:Uncharacterized protein n=1 Tax=Siphoviridae sp. ctwfx1 TaxID=2825732 RepID=A0A8S5UVF2_9CAUD|nr:MAG TPA: hypothetical protein [Siphoviridae sp. ctwfx1]